MTDYISWIATFIDGPCADHMHDRVFAVGPPHRDLYLMPNPSPTLKGHWILVGYDGNVPDSPWPDQVHYRLQEIVTMAGADCEPVAQYALSDD